MKKLSFSLFKKRAGAVATPVRWIPLLCLDVCFRAIFGSRGMEDVLLSLVNSVLRNAGLRPVAKLELRNPFILRRWRKDKEPIVDVHATDEQGNVFDIEMQVIEHADFDKRAEYYGSRLFVDQIGNGSNYGDLRRVVSIYFVLFPLRKNDDKRWFDVWRKISVYDQHIGNDLNTTIFVRLPTKIDQKPQGFVDSELQDWIAMFGYPKLTTDEQMDALKKKGPIFKKAGDKMLYFLSTKRGRRTKDLNERIRRDWVAINKFAEERGLEKGRDEGLKEGLEKGRDEGLKKGLKKGLKEGIINSFTMIVKNRFPIEYSNSCDDWSALLESKSVPELNDLINASLNCESFREIAERLSNV